MKSTKFNRGYYDVFVRTCAKYPSNIAVRNYGNRVFTNYSYSELYGVCEYISQILQQLQCVKGIVGLLVNRNMIVPCLIAAVHKCCPTFMFLDPNADNSAIITEINFKSIITVGYTDLVMGLLNKTPDKSVVIFDLVIDFFITDNLTFVCDNSKFNDYSFIAMTSGSTGEPKHIKIPVNCIRPNIDDLTKLFRISSYDVIYFSTPLTFDPSMIEILLACTNAASLLIAPDDVEVLFSDDPETAITFWQTTPSKFFQYSDFDISTKILGSRSLLKILALGGEPLNGINRIKQLKAGENCTKLFAMYGVTEMSCWACVTELDLEKIENDKDIPLGTCLSETTLQLRTVYDKKNIGNIVLGSKSRKCVLLNRPTTREKNTTKWVDTGDIGEMKNGTIFFRGRKDDVIKRFGHKVNLQKIEATIMQSPKIKACSCIWLPKPMLLVVYFISEQLTCQDVTVLLKSKLDDKHFPDQIIRVDSIPTNRHGKIWKSQLVKNYATANEQSMDFERLKTNFLSELQKSLNRNFSYSEIRDKDFYSIGGTSFLAVSLCNRLSGLHPHYSRLLPYLLSSRDIETAISAIRADPVQEDVLELHKEQIRSPAHGESQKKIDYNGPNVAVELIGQWAYDTGKCVDATPTIFNTDEETMVTVGSHSGKIIVLDARTGKLKGEITLNSRIEAPVLCYQETKLTGDAYGVVGTYDGTVICFVLDDCSEVWRLEIGAMVKSKGVCCDGMLYVAAYDGKVRCVDIVTGLEKQVINIGDGPISADLIQAKTEYIILGTLSGVCASIHVETNTVVWRDTLSSPVFASPVAYDRDKYVVFAEVNGCIHCRTVEKGIKIWKYTKMKGNIFSSLHIKQMEATKWQVIFGCHDNNVYSIVVDNFEPVPHWRVPMTSPVYSTPCALNECLIIAASSNGNICIMDAGNGKVLYEHQLPGETFSSPVAHDNRMYIGCRNDHLYSLIYNLRPL